MFQTGFDPSAISLSYALSYYGVIPERVNNITLTLQIIDTPVNLIHLKERMVQSQAWDKKKVFDRNILVQLLIVKINKTDFNEAKRDVTPFIKNSYMLEIWSKDFFKDILNKLQTVN